MMRSLFLLIVVVSLSACGAHNPNNEWFINSNTPKGFKSYDPPSGDWIFIQNQPFAAQRQAAQEYGWKWGDPNPPW